MPLEKWGFQMQSNKAPRLSEVYIQSLLIREAGTTPSQQLTHEPTSMAHAGAIATRANTELVFSIDDFQPQTHFLEAISSSTIPEIWRSELSSQYFELGQTLSEMTKLDADDDWKIDPPVYQTASFVAAQLMSHQIPTPTIFNHGSKSVVFNWTNGGDNLYLTISSDKISALISSPAMIKRREQFEARQLLNSPFFVLAFNAPTQTPLVLPAQTDSEPLRIG